ncbi:MAG: glycine zipper domain-containing protein [Planctomycetota bacterium]|jgi:uncharacterized protein YcfJ
MRNKVTVAVMCLVIISILATGCETTSKKSSGIGAGIGTVLGVGIGALLGDPGLGMTIGAGAGALGGAVVGDQLEEKREEAEMAELERQLEPEKKTESGEGKNYIDGHYEYEIKRKWIDTSQNEEVYVEERVEGDRRIDAHYENRLVPSGYWEEFEEKIWIPSHYE